MDVPTKDPSEIGVERAFRECMNVASSPQSETNWTSKDGTLNSPGPITVSNGDYYSDSTSFEENTTITWMGRLGRALLPKSFLKPSFPCKIRSLEKCDKGYPYLASFLDSDENFMIYRRFGFLHARLLLQKQDELRKLEEDLDRMDKRDRRKYPKLLQCRVDDDLRSDMVPETRRSLLLRIEDTILKYDQLLLNSQQLVASNRPPERDYNSVANFINHKKPLMQGDDDFIYNKEDLITLRPGRESAWLDAFVEKLLKLCPRRPVRYIFCSKESASKTEDKDLFLPTKLRVDRLVGFLIMMVVLVLLILPVYGLYHVSSKFDDIDANTSNAICMGILLVATLLFSAALALFTKAKRHEILGAAAAYCALLVVFIANLSSSASLH